MVSFLLSSSLNSRPHKSCVKVERTKSGEPDTFDRERIKLGYFLDAGKKRSHRTVNVTSVPGSQWRERPCMPVPRGAQSQDPVSSLQNSYRGEWQLCVWV